MLSIFLALMMFDRVSICPSSFPICFLVSISQSLTDLSSLPEASVLLSGLNATLNTLLVCPSSSPIGFWDSTSQSTIVLS
uniref:Secreted protein n=1 Tax=Arcella intermedia TaxID=1963864 RepID=A0A6B2LS79_9EUKA